MLTQLFIVRGIFQVKWLPVLVEWIFSIHWTFKCSKLTKLLHLYSFSKKSTKVFKKYFDLCLNKVWSFLLLLSLVTLYRCMCSHGLFIACWGIPSPVVTWSMVESTPDNRRQITTTGFKWRRVCQVLCTDPNKITLSYLSFIKLLIFVLSFFVLGF